MTEHDLSRPRQLHCDWEHDRGHLYVIGSGRAWSYGDRTGA